MELYRFSLFFGECFNRCKNKAMQLPGFENSLSRRRGIFESEANSALSAQHVVKVSFLQQPQPRVAYIRQDAEQPRAKAIAIAKVFQFQEGGEERLLNRVFSIGAVKQSPSESERANAITLDELAKRQPISGKHPLDYRSVVLGSHAPFISSGVGTGKGCASPRQIGKVGAVGCVNREGKIQAAARISRALLRSSAICALSASASSNLRSGRIRSMSSSLMRSP